MWTTAAFLGGDSRQPHDDDDDANGTLIRPVQNPPTQRQRWRRRRGAYRQVRRRAYRERHSIPSPCVPELPQPEKPADEARAAAQTVIITLLHYSRGGGKCAMSATRRAGFVHFGVVMIYDTFVNVI
ncbi:hypothetical protein VC83_07184 [Pseudogymnoascus destructans]|uniref:Uncharacterized protein n=1 Tax=Pseudogymnoascus destructans TaxID=655981 RepID=A0A177A5M2_9PEZI|nr:uncharacterized protein VC83_07184 [Pseudogymnoascus destructans]OAF56531.1 hypothetical protein VC83_07184 [Pseudogymnoascus destructans]